MPKLPEGTKPRVPLNCLIASETRTMLFSLVGELEMSQGEVVDRAIQALTAGIAFGPESLNAPKLGRKKSKRQQMAEALKASDPLAQAVERDDIDYTRPDDLPSGGSVGVAHLDAVSENRGKATVETWRANRRPLLKPGQRK